MTNDSPMITANIPKPTPKPTPEQILRKLKHMDKWQ
jgi:hypothetical protein